MIYSISKLNTIITCVMCLEVGKVKKLLIWILLFFTLSSLWGYLIIDAYFCMSYID